MTDRERFLAWMLGQPADRPPFWLYWGGWERTWQRWKCEGIPDQFTSFGDVREHFGSDRIPAVVGVNCGPCPRREITVIEEDDDYYTWTDGWGIKRRNPKANESMSQFLEFPVKDRRGWLEYRDRWLDPDHPERLSGDWRDNAARWTAEGVPIQLGYYPDVATFGALRWLLGDEECLLAFYTDPDLLREILDHLTSLYLTVFEKVAAEVRVDLIHVWEDMCGRQGPLISPSHWAEFLGPCYRRIKAFADAHDIRLISVDTDGQPELIISPMMAAGVSYLYPMEVAAGCDVNDVRERYPELAMMGGIDKRALAVGPDAIDAELARVRPAMEKGRYIPDLDHCIPDDVSWPNYCYYAEALRKMVGKAAPGGA